MPDFDRTRIRGGASPYAEPVMPGEQRLIPRMQDMQDKLQPALPPVRKAQIDAGQFLEEFLLGQMRPSVAQIAPKNLPGLEADLQGMATQGAGPYIRGTSPYLEGLREGVYEQNMRRRGNPLFSGV